jgi:hypothetical protein
MWNFASWTPFLDLMGTGQQRKYTAERYLDPIIIGNHFKQEPSFIRMEQLLYIKKRNL